MKCVEIDYENERYLDNCVLFKDNEINYLGKMYQKIFFDNNTIKILYGLTKKETLNTMLYHFVQMLSGKQKDIEKNALLLFDIYSIDEHDMKQIKKYITITLYYTSINNDVKTSNFYEFIREIVDRIDCYKLDENKMKNIISKCILKEGVIFCSKTSYGKKRILF